MRRDFAEALGSALGSWLPDLPPTTAAGGRIRLLEEFLTLIGRVSAEQPVVLVIEDLHWADASSREAFAYLARNLTSVLLIGTARTGVDHPGAKLLTELARRPDVLSIELAPLAQRHVNALITAIDGRPADPARSSRIHRRSGGNPLFIEALHESDEAPAPSLSALLLNRVAELPPRAAALLSVVAVAGASVSDEVLLTVSDQPEPELQLALRELIDRDQLVIRRDGYAIRHDLIRETVYNALLPGERRQLHARYAQVLAEKAEPTTALTDHWTAADEPELALSTAWQAAGTVHFAYDEELYLLERVLALWGRVADPVALIGTARADVLERAANAAHAAGKTEIGIAHCTAALAELSEAEPERVARLLGQRGRLQVQLRGEGLDDLHRALAIVPEGAELTRGRLLAALAWIDVNVSSAEVANNHAAEALELGNRLGDKGIQAQALLALAGAGRRFPVGSTKSRELFAASREAAEEVGDHHTYLTSVQWEALGLNHTGRYAEAAELLRSGRQLAERVGQGRSRGSMLALNLAMALDGQGAWDEALELIDEALADDPPPFYATGLGLIAAGIELLRGETTRYDELLRDPPEFLTQQSPTTLTGFLRRLKILRATVGGDLEAADREITLLLQATADQRTNLDFPLTLLAAARVQQARRTANPRSRAEVAARLERIAALAEAPADAPQLSAAVRLSVAAIRSNAMPDWDSAIQAWRDFGNLFELASALTAGAASALSTSNRSGAQLRLREARALATQLRATPLLTQIASLADRAQLVDEPKSQPVEFGLTPRELQVLRVLARGRSNAEIAAELFISVNTVASHVARILTKLGVTTRTEAASVAHERGLL